MGHWVRITLAVLCVAVFTASAPASAQSLLQGARTCSDAYGKCFDYCSNQFPGGSEKSARCVDQCTLARAKCDRGGCFRTKMASLCGLSKR
jgi:hypothetical protein